MVNVRFVCGTCWWEVPAKERVAVHAMFDRGYDVTTKIAKIVRMLKEKACTKASS